jgi:DNA-binding transcriptional LysR family regulator
MEIKHLRVLVAVIEEGSVLAASRRLHIAQPALSRRIRDLEDMLGCALLVRGARGVTPTRAGLALYRDALAIIDAVAEAEQRAQRLGLQQARAIRLGLVLTSRKYEFLREALAAFQASHPEAGVAFTRGHSRDLAGAMREGQLDATLLYELHLNSDRVAQRLVHKERYVLAAHPSHRLAVAGAATFAELAAEPLICMLRQDRADNENPMLQQLRQHGLEPVVDQWAGSPEEIIELVMVTGGLCITPASSIVSTPPGQLVFRALPDFAMELELWACWTASPATSALSAFIDHLNRAIERHQQEIRSAVSGWTVLDGVPLFRATD